MAVKERKDKVAGVGWINCINCEAVSSTEVIVSFDYNFNSGKYKLNEYSVCIYLSDDPTIDGNYTRTNIPPGAPTDTHILVNRYFPQPPRFTVKYKFTGLDPNTWYYFRPCLRVRKSDGETTVKNGTLHSPPLYWFPCKTMNVYTRNQALFEIAKPTTAIVEDPEAILDENKMTWVDLTNYITVPSYDVNYTDVNEDWTDANYTTHRIVARTKVSGKFNMLFTSIEDYNKFYDLIKINRDMYGEGYTYLRVQVNNELDYDDPRATTLSDYKPMRRAGLYFIKIDSNPWTEPYYGHYDKYQAISVSIEEA